MRAPINTEVMLGWFSAQARASMVVSDAQLRGVAARPICDLDAGCLNRAAGITMSEVRRATARASISTAVAARTGGVPFVHRFRAALNARVHLYLCMLDGVVASCVSGWRFAWRRWMRLGWSACRRQCGSGCCGCCDAARVDVR